MKPFHTTEQAIEAAVRALHGGMPSMVLKHYLIQDGYTNSKASVIIRWATQFNKRKHGHRTQTNQPSR